MKVRFAAATIPETCYHACLAMVTGYSYETVIQTFAKYAEREELVGEGLEDAVAFEWLARRGFAVQQLFHESELDGLLHNPWPPIPFAPVHILGVQSLGSHAHHAVVMLHTGMVLDPNDNVRTERPISDYRRVYDCTGIWDLRRRGASYDRIVKQAVGRSQ